MVLPANAKNMNLLDITTPDSSTYFIATKTISGLDKGVRIDWDILKSDIIASLTSLNIVSGVSSVNSKSGAVLLDSSHISDTTNKRYVTDAQLIILGNTSNINSGDNATNTQYSSDYRAANFVAGTNYLAPAGNGSALTGLTKSQVGLGSVDNTSDASKPVSTAQSTALNLKANLASPIFTGTVVLPAGQVVNGVTLISGGSSTEYLSKDGTYSIPAGGGGGSGDVVGPGSSINNRVVFFDGVTGKLLKDSGLTLAGNNTGDQTSIVGISGTKAQFDTAVSDGNVVYVGDNISADNVVDGTTNKAYTATEKTKLAGIATGATANSSDATLLNRANHTGTQVASTISNFDTAVAANSAVTLNTAKVTNATHTGDVTGSGALTIDKTAITGKTTVTGVGADYILISDTSDSGNLKKALASDFGGGGGKYKFAIAGAIGATGTNVANTIVIDGTKTLTSCNVWYGTAGSGTLTVDINKNGTTLFSTTKPNITTTNQYSINSGTLTTTALASGDILTLDIDAVPGTAGVDLYVELNYS